MAAPSPSTRCTQAWRMRVSPVFQSSMASTAAVRWLPLRAREFAIAREATLVVEVTVTHVEAQTAAADCCHFVTATPVIPIIIYGVLGTSRHLGVGPVAIVSLLVEAAVRPLASNESRPARRSDGMCAYSDVHRRAHTVSHLASLYGRGGAGQFVWKLCGALLALMVALRRH